MNGRLMISTLVAGSALASPFTANAAPLWCTETTANGEVGVVVHDTNLARQQLNVTLDEMESLVQLLRGVRTPDGVDARVEMLMRDLVNRTRPGGDLACW